MPVGSPMPFGTVEASHAGQCPGTVYEAPTFSQWVSAFSLSHALIVCESHAGQLHELTFGNDHMVLSTV